MTMHNPKVRILEREGYCNWDHDYDYYDEEPLCEVLYGEGDNELNLVVCHETIVPATYKLTFSPLYQYELCGSPQYSGYINTGHFNRELDVTKQLYLCVNRDISGEDYYFHYFLVEV